MALMVRTPRWTMKMDMGCDMKVVGWTNSAHRTLIGGQSTDTR